MAAISAPPRAGPAIITTLPRKAASEARAGISSSSTSRGERASSEGRCRPVRADIQADTAYRTQTWGFPSAARASAPLPRASPTSVARIIRRRSTVSARAPPRKAVTSSGSSSAKPRSPTFSEEWVRWNIW